MYKRSFAEAPEFAPAVLQTLRQPLEHGELALHRASGAATYPARFQLVLAANPCPCGQAYGRGLDCECTPMQRRRYFSRLSGPLLDRVDLQVEVHPASGLVAAPGTRGEASALVAARVADARDSARERLRGTPWVTNAEVPGHWLRDRFGLDRTVTTDLDRAVEIGTLSMRGMDRVLRVACSIADLTGRATPGRHDIGEALVLRTRGRGAA